MQRVFFDFVMFVTHELTLDWNFHCVRVSNHLFLFSETYPSHKQFTAKVKVLLSSYLQNDSYYIGLAWIVMLSEKSPLTSFSSP